MLTRRSHNGDKASSTFRGSTMSMPRPCNTVEMIIAFAGVFGSLIPVFIVWIVAHYTCAAFKAWQEIALKRDMVARGYTAQEIVEVVAAETRRQA